MTPDSSLEPPKVEAFPTEVLECLGAVEAGTEHSLPSRDAEMQMQFWSSRVRGLGFRVLS